MTTTDLVYALKPEMATGGDQPTDGGQPEDVGAPTTGSETSANWPSGIAKDEALNADRVKSIYQTMVGGEPDAGGLEYWSNSGMTTTDLVYALKPEMATGGDQSTASDHPSTGDAHHMDMGPRIEWLPPEEVADFVNSWMASQPIYQDSKIMMAEKVYDAKDENRFVYKIDLDNGMQLIFDDEKSYAHAASSDPFAFVEEESVTDSIPSVVSSTLSNSYADYTVVEVLKELF